MRQRARRDACNAMSRQRPPPGYLSTVSWTHEGETTYKARFVTSLHKPAMFNLVHILTGMRRSGKTFQLFQLITEYKKRWASAHADAHLECPYSSAEHGRGTLAHRCSRRPFRRARETGLPTISMDSNSGGLTRRPDMATRTGPKARRGL